MARIPLALPFPSLLLPPSPFCSPLLLIPHFLILPLFIIASRKRLSLARRGPIGIATDPARLTEFIILTILRLILPFPLRLRPMFPPIFACIHRTPMITILTVFSCHPKLMQLSVMEFTNSHAFQIFHPCIFLPPPLVPKAVTTTATSEMSWET